MATTELLETTTPTAQLSNHELRVLESTLRVQLEVAKHVRVAQVTGALGVVWFSGALSAIPAGISIVTSQVQRTKCKRRHRKVTREMLERGLQHLVEDEKRLGKRAFGISVATGCVCCIVSFAADLLIDRAVLQVVSEVLMESVDQLIMGSLQSHITTQLGVAATVAAVSEAHAANDQETHQQLKPTRSWSGFKSKWTDRKNKQANKLRAESLPPDLFGERDSEEDSVVAVDASLAPRRVEIHRSSDLLAYGECLELRFSTIHPGSEDLPEDLFPSESLAARRWGSATLTGENDALSKRHWLSLWTLEDGPIDIVTLDLDDVNLCGASDRDDAFELFGTSSRDGASELFGRANDEDEAFELFGVPEDDEEFDLFGLSATSSIPQSSP